MKKHYDNIIADYGSLDILLAAHASALGKEWYDRREEIDAFLANAINPMYSANDYYATLHDPRIDPATEKDHAMLHVAANMWECQDWHLGWEIGSSSFKVTLDLIKLSQEMGLTTLVVSGDVRLLGALAPDTEVLFFEAARQHKLWTYEGFRSHFGFSSDLDTLFHALINFSDAGEPPILEPDEARRALSEYNSVSEFLASPPASLTASQIERLTEAASSARV